MPTVTCAQLLERGDLAVRERDAVSLADIALALSKRVGDPLRDELRALASTCRRDAKTPVRAWRTIRAAVAARVAFAGT
jgi:hypothetical protein